MSDVFEYYNFFKTPTELMLEAKEGLNGNWKKSVTVNFVYELSKVSFWLGIILMINSLIFVFNLPLLLSFGILFVLISIFTYGPLKVSKCKHCINLVKNTNPQTSDLAFGFKNKYMRNVGYGISLFFIYLFTFILFIIPFINKFVHYQISGYILAEDLNLSVSEALKISTRLSKGNFSKYIKIFFRLFHHYLLSFVTGGIYYLWLAPRYSTIMYCYYKDLKE
ncbi:MAG: DUF975 family protein [Clostridiales bacterium]|nr:DUF975 family protein [Clostridiales bacterium]